MSSFAIAWVLATTPVAVPPSSLDDRLRLSAVDPTPHAKEVISALRIYEESVRSLEYNIVTHNITVDEVRLVRWGSEWWESDGKWGTRFWKLVQIAPGSHVRAPEELKWAYDGLRMMGKNPARKAGVIREPRFEWTGYISPRALLGRHIDSRSGRLLWQLMAEARYLDVVEEAGRWRLTGLADLGYLVAELSVVVDPNRGWAPCAIEVRDGVLRTLHNGLYITGWTQVSGVQLPTAGVQHQRSRVADDAGYSRFEQELQIAGIVGKPDWNQNAHLVAARAAARLVWGDEGPPSQPLGYQSDGCIWQCGVFTYLSMNALIPPERFQIAYEREDRVFDEFRDMVKPAGSDEFKPQ